MQQATHLRLARSTTYPWELTDETRQVGKQGLARVRAILDSKVRGPAQQELQLNVERPIAA